MPDAMTDRLLSKSEVERLAETRYRTGDLVRKAYAPDGTLCLDGGILGRLAGVDPVDDAIEAGSG